MAVVAFLVRRCAWCSRVYGPDGWTTAPEGDPDGETATICPDCAERLHALRRKLSS